MVDRIGILIDLKAGRVKDVNFGMITAARGNGRELWAIVIDGSGGELKEALETYGIHKIIDISLGDNTCEWHPAVWGEAVVKAMAEFQIRILFGMSGGRGNELLPRIAAALNAPLVMDCIHVDLGNRMVKTSRYSGKTVATIKIGGTHLILGIRPMVFRAVAKPTGAKVINYAPAGIDTRGMNVLETGVGRSTGLDLTEAQVIVSGGRGMNNGDNFDILFECAEQLGAAVGASRAAVDAGWVPYAMQVGQTGVKVNPKVYIACGISGSVQHFAGMKTSGLVIAVNTDPDAPIIGSCDYYITADLFDIIPRLTQRLKKK